MTAFTVPVLSEIGDTEVRRFRKHGFIIFENLLNLAQVEELRASFPKLFAGDFDTGVYPDEWYWREGMSMPDVTRHIANAWKSDLNIAKLALSADLGRAASKFAAWPGARLGQDTIWWKMPHTKPISLHQDTSFMDFLDPPSTITCWIALDNTHRDAGTLEYIPGSHRWPLTPLPVSFHAEDDYRAQMKSAAEAANIVVPEPVLIEVSAGSCVFHAGEIWHGSGPNKTTGHERRSIGIHMVHQDAVFTDRHGGYIYRRYQRTGEYNLDESFFPILWSEGGRRTGWIDNYCKTGMRRC